MSGMIDRGKYASLEEALADVADIDKVVQAVAREAAIREGMATTGESREIVTEAVDAAVSMDREAVLDLMDGEPTTLGRALARYVEELAGRYPNGMHTDSVIAELDALLNYPWPGADHPLVTALREKVSEIEDMPPNSLGVIPGVVVEAAGFRVIITR